MAQRTCSVSGCERKHKGLGYCCMHLQRIRKFGEPGGCEPLPKGFPARPAEERFWSKVDRRGPDECWPWIASLNGSGYGSLNVGRQSVMAHRFAYEHFVGPIPPDHDIDHLCFNRACVNPAHLEPVTPKENSQRMALRNSPCCPQGHPYDAENTYHYKGHRQCKKCRKVHFAKWYAKQKAAA